MKGMLVKSFDANGRNLGPQVEADYNPLIFSPNSIPDAKEIILQSGFNMTSDQRWEQETADMRSYLNEHLDLNPSSLVLDYGCGIGRLAKLIIDTYGCTVVGVDISMNMLSMATYYVHNPRFIAMTIEAVERLGLEFDAAIAVWVLQHCQQPETDIGFLRERLYSGGRLMVLNERQRYVPIIYGRGVEWLDDGADIWDELARQFQPIGEPQPFLYRHGQVAYYEKLDPLAEGVSNG